MSTIFGYEWEQIQAMQHGNYKPRPAVGGKPTASQSDIDLLESKGLHYIMGNGLHGVFDRLQTSGLIPSS